jgi:hypothetical protein
MAIYSTPTEHNTYLYWYYPDPTPAPWHPPPTGAAVIAAPPVPHGSMIVGHGPLCYGIRARPLPVPVPPLWAFRGPAAQPQPQPKRSGGEGLLKSAAGLIGAALFMEALSRL